MLSAVLLAVIILPFAGWLALTLYLGRDRGEDRVPEREDETAECVPEMRLAA